MALVTRLRIVGYEPPLAVPDYMEELGSKILPAWLSSLMGRHFRPESSKWPLAQQILDDFEFWIGNRGDPLVLRRARWFLDDVREDGMDEARRLVHLWGHVIDTGKVANLTDGFKDLLNEESAAAVQSDRASCDVFVPDDAWSRWIESTGLPRWQLRSLAKHWKSDGAIVQHYQLGDRRGHLISDQLWQKQINAFRLTQKRWRRRWTPAYGRPPTWSRPISGIATPWEGIEH
jgi:hypothetical protein